VYVVNKEKAYCSWRCCAVATPRILLLPRFSSVAFSKRVDYATINRRKLTLRRFTVLILMRWCLWVVNLS